MDLTLHIGPHKTGTTAVQTAFADNASVLRKRGILYPKCNWMYPAQHRLAFEMKGKINPTSGDRPNLQTELDELCRTLEKARLPRVFLSSEEFFASPLDAIRQLKDRLPVTSTTIIAFPRRPDSFLVSCYNQKTKQAGNGFAAPIARFIKEPRKIAPEIDYLGCVSNWADVFGDDTIRLRPFEDGSPLEHLAAHFGVSNLLKNASHNKSVPGAVAEVMRLAKAQDMPHDQQRRLFSKASAVFADWPQFSIPDGDRLDIIKTFEAENDVLFARFGQVNPYSSKTFQPEPTSREQNINVHDMMTLIASLL